MWTEQSWWKGYVSYGLGADISLAPCLIGSLLRSRLSGCHATLPRKKLLSGERCVTSRKTAAKETTWSGADRYLKLSSQYKRSAGRNLGGYSSWYAALAPRLEVLLTGSCFFLPSGVQGFSFAHAQIFRTEVITMRKTRWNKGNEGNDVLDRMIDADFNEASGWRSTMPEKKLENRKKNCRKNHDFRKMI